MVDETKLTAATRLEKLLDNIAGGENEVTPATRLEKFLSYIADAMEGGGSGGTVPVPSVSEAGMTLRVNNSGQLVYVEDPIIVNMLPLPNDYEFPTGATGGFYLDVLPEDLVNKNFILHYSGFSGSMQGTADIFTTAGYMIIPELSDVDKLIEIQTLATSLADRFGIHLNENFMFDSYQGYTYNGYFIMFTGGSE